MNSHQAALVQSSFVRIQPILETAMSMFYDRLFALDPSLQQMFRSSRTDQARKLATALTMVVKSIDCPQRIKGAVEALGRRHVGYGVRDEHYTTVGLALLETLEAGLGEAFTAEVRDAWSAAYGWLTFTMREAAGDEELLGRGGRRAIA